MNNNKEIIEDIKNKLKEMPELPYKEGSWERYKSLHTNTSDAKGAKVHLIKKLSIAAAFLFVGSVGYILYLNNQNEYPAESILSDRSISADKDVLDQVDLDSYNKIESMTQDDIHKNINTSTSILTNKDLSRNDVHIASLRPVNGSLQLVDNSMLSTNHSLENIEKAHVIVPKIITNENLRMEKVNENWQTLAQSNPEHVIQKHNNNQYLGQQSTKFGFKNKFELGLYVSPYKTSDEFNVGAGFLVAYNISKNISVRTGSSYNSYTVGQLKDPNASDSYEVVTVSEDMAYNKGMVVAESSAVSSKMLLPNINAVVGKIESIEIPLEVTYKFNKGLYTSVGASYSAIISQNRKAEYINNKEMSSLKDNVALIPNKANEVNAVQTSIVESSISNVSTSGFNGFINLSIGKKLEMQKNFKISVEPFVKIPVGQFRNSDLDYTNSGVKIITSF